MQTYSGHGAFLIYIMEKFGGGVGVRSTVPTAFDLDRERLCGPLESGPGMADGNRPRN